MNGNDLKRALDPYDQALLAQDFSALSKRVKKRPVVLYFGRATFSDNTKYLYLQALAAARSYEVYWCSGHDELIASLRAQGLPCLHLGEHIDVSIDMLLHAAVAVFCVNPNESVRNMATLVPCLDGATKIQLWHGVSVKRLGLQLISHLGTRDINLRRPWEFSSRADVVLSTAGHFDGYWREVFGCRTLLRAGYPRNEVLLRPASELEMLGAELDEPTRAALLDPAKRAVLVVPTWQRFQNTFVSEPAFFARLLLHARKRGVNLFIKLHPSLALGDTGTHGERTPGLYLLPAGVDVYPWLRHFSGLLTDYSSIMFDFLHTGKPVMRLDLPPGEHQNFEPDYALIPDGEFAHVFDAANVEAVFDAMLGDDTLAAARQAMCGRLFETPPLLASEQIERLVERRVAQAVADDFTVLTV